MQINPDYNTAAYTIRSYDKGLITIYEPISAETIKELNPQKEKTHQQINTRLLKQHDTFIVTPKKLIEHWDIGHPNMLTKKHFQILLDLEPELVILGTGNKIHFPAAETYLFLQQQGIGVEMMDTSAACRTYNFLIADGRNVAAGLFMI